MKDEEVLYPTDILRTKYITVLEAAQRCNTTIHEIVKMVEDKKIPYALFSTSGKRQKVVHVNYEDVERVLRGDDNAS